MAYVDELERALARPDADKLVRQVASYAKYFAEGAGDWPDEHSDDFAEIDDSHRDDPEKCLAYVVLAASQTDDPEFLGFVACGPLEDVLRNPSPELLERIEAEARKSARFRWLLSFPYKTAVSAEA
jgi:hypothetical protein